MTLPSGPKRGAGWCWRRSPGTRSECSGTLMQPHRIQKTTSNARANTRTTLHQYADHSTVSATQSEHWGRGSAGLRLSSRADQSTLMLPDRISKSFYLKALPSADSGVWPFRAEQSNPMLPGITPCSDKAGQEGI